MKNTLLVCVLIFSYVVNVNAQTGNGLANNSFKINHFVDLSVGSTGKDNIVSAAYGHIWGLGKEKQLRLGYGVRSSSYYSGSSKEYLSAPPDYYGKKDKTDTVTISNPQQNNLTLFITATYRIKRKLELGFTIDLVGYSFGTAKNAKYVGNNSTVAIRASPNTITALLVGANDRGMVKSEFMIGYWFSEKWMARTGVASLYTEYKTPTELQQGNDRYRGTSVIPFIAIRYSPKHN